MHKISTQKIVQKWRTTLKKINLIFCLIEGEFKIWITSSQYDILRLMKLFLDLRKLKPAMYILKILIKHVFKNKIFKK